MRLALLLAMAAAASGCAHFVAIDDGEDGCRTTKVMFLYRHTTCPRERRPW